MQHQYQAWLVFCKIVTSCLCSPHSLLKTCWLAKWKQGSTQFLTTVSHAIFNSGNCACKKQAGIATLRCELSSQAYNQPKTLRSIFLYSRLTLFSEHCCPLLVTACECAAGSCEGPAVSSLLLTNGHSWRCQEVLYMRCILMRNVQFYAFEVKQADRPHTQISSYAICPVGHCGNLIAKRWQF